MANWEGELRELEVRQKCQRLQICPCCSLSSSFPSSLHFLLLLPGFWAAFCSRTLEAWLCNSNRRGGTTFFSCYWDFFSEKEKKRMWKMDNVKFCYTWPTSASWSPYGQEYWQKCRPSSSETSLTTEQPLEAMPHVGSQKLVSSAVISLACRSTCVPQPCYLEEMGISLKRYTDYFIEGLLIIEV